MHYKEGIHDGETPLPSYFPFSAWRETPYYSPAGKSGTGICRKPYPGFPEEEDKRSYSRASSTNIFRKEEDRQDDAWVIVQINSWNRVTRSFGTEPGKYKVREAVAN